MDKGLVVRYVLAELSLTISPGGGSVGSLSCRFINTVERRRPVCDGCLFRVEALDDPVAWLTISLSKFQAARAGGNNLLGWK